MSLSQALLIPGAGGAWCRILSISPESADQGETLDITITGRDFEDGDSADFGANVTVNSTTFVSETELTANITVAADLSATGTRTLTLTRGTKTKQLLNCLTVVQTLGITSISPATANNSDTLDITVTGIFEEGDDVSFGEDVTVNEVTFVNATTVTANITVASDLSETGTRDVTVTRDALSGVLADGFTATKLYLLRDDFTVGGSMDTPRTCVPGPGTLTTVETDGDLTIDANGRAAIPIQESPGWGDLGWYGGAQTRAAGLALVARVSKYRKDTVGPVIGWSATEVANYTGLNSSGVIFNNNGYISRQTDQAVTAYDKLAAYDWTTDYDVFSVLRATGSFLIKATAGASTGELLFVDATDNTATLYPVCASYSDHSEVDTFRVVTGHPRPTPVVSDSFTGTNGTELNGRATDGAGAEETGGSGFVWTASAGVQLNGSGAATIPAVYKGGMLDAGVADGIIETQQYTNNGQPTIFARYFDSSNYVRINCVSNLGQFVVKHYLGGVESDLGSVTGLSYNNSTTRLQVVMQGALLAAYLLDSSGNIIASLGPYTLTGVLVTATKFGIYNFNASTWPVTLYYVNFWPATVAVQGNTYDADAAPTYDAKIFVDATLGNDSAEATTEDTPLLTLAAARTLVATRTSDKTIALKSGETWREALDLSASVLQANTTIKMYGGEDNAVVSAAELIDVTSATQPDAGTYPNLWLATPDNFGTGDLVDYMRMIADGVPMLRVMVTGESDSENRNRAANVAADLTAAKVYVNGNANTFYYRNNSGTQEFYFYSATDPTGGAVVYEATYRGMAIQNANATVLRNVTMTGNLSRNGLPYNNTYKDNKFYGCRFTNQGGTHGQLVGGKYWEDCVCDSGLASGYQGTGGGFHGNSPASNQLGHAYVRCKSYGWGVGFYDHDTLQPFVVLIDCEAERCNYVFGYAASCVASGGTMHAIGCYMKGTIFSPPNAGCTMYYEDCEFYLGAPFGEFLGGTHRFHNCRFYVTPISNCGCMRITGGTSDMDFNYCSFFVDYDAGSALTNPVNNHFLQRITDPAGSLVIRNSNIFVKAANLDVGSGGVPFIMQGTGGTLTFDYTQNNHIYLAKDDATPDYVGSSMFSANPGTARDWSLVEGCESDLHDIGWRSGRASAGYRAAAEALAASLNV